MYASGLGKQLLSDRRRRLDPVRQGDDDGKGISIASQVRDQLIGNVLHLLLNPLGRHHPLHRGDDVIAPESHSIRERVALLKLIVSEGSDDILKDQCIEAAFLQLRRDHLPEGFQAVGHGHAYAEFIGTAGHIRDDFQNHLPRLFLQPIRRKDAPQNQHAPVGHTVWLQRSVTNFGGVNLIRRSGAHLVVQEVEEVRFTQLGDIEVGVQEGVIDAEKEEGDQ